MGWYLFGQGIANWYLLLDAECRRNRRDETRSAEYVEEIAGSTMYQVRSTKYKYD
jgi:hypothetical protein